MTTARSDVDVIVTEFGAAQLKGQSLALRTTPDTGTLATIVWTEQIYMAPKSDGRLIVEATEGPVRERRKLSIVGVVVANRARR